jgi:hypothetical protein
MPGSVQISDLIQTRAVVLALLRAGRLAPHHRLTLNYGCAGSGAAAPRSEQRMNSFDPLAINPVSATPGVVTFAAVERRPRSARSRPTEQLRPARRLRLPAGSATGAPCPARWYRNLLRPDGQQHDRRLRRSASRRRQLRRVPRRPRRARSRCATVSRLLAAGSDRRIRAVHSARRRTPPYRSSNPHQVAPTSLPDQSRPQHELRRGSSSRVGYIGNISRH